MDNDIEVARKNARRRFELWRDKNPGRMKAIRAAMSANARYPGTVTADDIEFVIESSDQICCWCKKENLTGTDLTIEHLQPINERQYLAVACRACNAAKLHKGAARRQTQEERVARQQEQERKWQERNAEKARLRKQKLYERDQEITKLRSALREAQLKLQGKKRQQTEEQKAAAVERARQWRLAHPERSAEAKHQSYLRRKDQLKVKQLEYYEANKEKIKAQAKARYEAKKAAKALTAIQQ